jgi:ParB/RepB/Spo0J family partition protein
VEGTTLLPLVHASTADAAKAQAIRRERSERKTPRFEPRVIRLADIDRDENQPRVTPRSAENQASLVESVRRDGFFSVPTVQPGEGSRYTLITGEGRLVAAEACGYEEVLCLVCVTPLAPEEIHRMQFAENMFREPLNPIDQATLFRTLMREQGWSQVRIAKFLGVSQGHVSEYVKLLKLPPEVRERVASGKLGVRAAVRQLDRQGQSTVDTEAAQTEAEPSPFAGDDPFGGATVHPDQSWIDEATGIMFAVGRRSKRAVTDKEILRALKARVAVLEARLGPPTPNP